ncbi:hypothetical protein [Streptomyces sp. AM 2-1-1]|uniref:hypothetical protein n=1 Tax=Streptomyces sp. AM 2-1-1 TaxID=3028709 RepID=UPI0023B9D0E5|nr:hypothetical protein [Streptomyces sp. AM 2-1-1]WEH41251.1 hypothetical protein PZB77_18070 [Streptomyces sp. AM 2-1-1]
MTITDGGGPLPDPRELLEGTDWASLEHAYGSAEGAAPVMGGLLAADLDTQARAMRYLEDPVHHQDTIYSATVPAALYVAASLSEPRTATMLPREQGERPLRAAMLDWLESVARAVGDDAEAIRERFGFSWDPASLRIRALRPALFRAVSPFLHDLDPAVHEAAIAAAVSLLDAPELVRYRTTLVPLVREVLAASAERSYRSVAVGGLRAWGKDTADPQAVENEDPRAAGRSSEMPL